MSPAFRLFDVEVSGVTRTRFVRIIDAIRTKFDLSAVLIWSRNGLRDRKKDDIHQ